MPALRIVVGLVVAAALVVAVPASASRGPAPVPAGWTLPAGWTGTSVPITVNGLARSYVLIRPQTTSTTPLPVLMELQGCCTTPAVEAQRSGFIDVTGPAILVYPVGYQQSWNAGSCCHQAQADHVDDVAFLTAVVNQVLTDQPDAATGHVYLAGYSNGGRMALRMACAAPQLFTAVASYGAVNAAACPDPAPVSLLEAAGTADPELTLGPGGAPHSINGYTEPTVQQQVDQYRRADSCATNPATHTQGNLTSTTWTGCRSGDAVQLSLYQGGNHRWPQARGVTPSAAQVMWAFFQTIHTSGSDPK